MEGSLNRAPLELTNNMCLQEHKTTGTISILNLNNIVSSMNGNNGLGIGLLSLRVISTYCCTKGKIFVCI